MTERQDAVRGHYEAETGPDFLSRVQALLETLPPGPIEPSQLAGLDQFHMGGLPATMRLAELAGARPGITVLDAGSGLGGPARYLAKAMGCRVAGVDLSPSYAALATMLAERTGLAGQVTFQVGDLLGLPFPADHFDLVWTQHVAMNIADRPSLYREFRRVLKPDGKLALHDVLWADGKPQPLFPVPWAESPANSTLLTEAETQAVLGKSGFKPLHWLDVTAEALAWASQPRPSAAGRPSLAAVMGPRFAGMSANFGRNLREGRLRLMMGVFQADG
ncbi:MAG TPA: methyltransferase domain-containing protein [Rhodopila sp.]|nr:methyltransferase domain-containing protein [Rhodopila sp.]